MILDRRGRRSFLYRYNRACIGIPIEVIYTDDRSNDMTVVNK